MIPGEFPKILLYLAFLLPLLEGSSGAGSKILINSILIDTAILEKDSSLILTMASGTESILSFIDSKTFESPNKKAFEIARALELHSKITQAPITNLLNLRGVDFESFWISNKIYIKDATPSLVFMLLDQMPDGVVSEMREEILVPMMPKIGLVQEGTETPKPTIQWGIDSMGAPKAWEKGFFGQGIICGVIDTGYKGTHKDLTGKNVGWFDPILHTPNPTDSDGHGSHTTGTMLGSNGVGMAPNATCVACVACTSATCPESALNSCGQFMICPKKNSATSSCPTKPHLVSCSWGGGGNSTWYKTIVNCWRAAGIVPVFALGNSGPECTTAGSPGDYDNLIGVGAVDKSGNIADFSSRGPPIGSTNTKPDLCAPGVDITSCSHLTDTGYATMSGTSMACPHVAGMVALLLCKNKNMGYNEIVDTMKTTCGTQLVGTGQTCGGIGDGTFPNHIFGSGEANCVNALTMVQASKENTDIDQEDKI